MRISELAQLLNLASKETIEEVEHLRGDLTGQGFKLAKKLTAASGIDEDAVRIIMVAVDMRRQESLRAKEAEEEAVRREEQEHLRKAEEDLRRKEEEERRKASEEARRKADEELERRRAQLARISAIPAIPATPPPLAPIVQEAAPAAPPAAPPVQPPQHPPARMEAAQAPPAARQADPRQQPQARKPDSGQRGETRDSRGRKNEKPARQVSLEKFVDRGLGPTLVEEHRPRRRDDKAPRRKEEVSAEEQRRRAAARGKPRDTTRRSVAPSQIFRGEIVARRAAQRPERGRRRPSQRSSSRSSIPSIVSLTGDFTVGEFAERCRLQAAEVMGKLFEMGEMRTINQILEPDLAELVATDLGIEIQIKREGDEFDVEEYLHVESDPEALQPRPPVVTIMGHVDHGKTTLLDSIRDANVVDSEAGGITQHIGAYYVTTEKGDIVFLDTPGHEAFTAMRARGANSTDLVVLVVAANDGVMPQTVEAINHARAAGVPLIVAVNKIDVEGANPQRVKQELMRYEIVSEDLGGDTIMVEISAKEGTNVRDLLEMIALQAEVLELMADPVRPAMGSIIESHVDPHRGAIATVLVQEGTLRGGDCFLCGTEYGRIRAMRDDHGKLLTEAGPARPVEIMGLNGSPAAGEQLLVMPDEASAREIAERRSFRRKSRAAIAKPHISLDNLKEHIDEGEIRSLNLVIKGDVQGSVEAIANSLMKIESDKIGLRILHSATGAVTESDVQLADASDAIILGFNVRPDPATRDLAENLGVQVKLYSIIYDLIEDIRKAMLGMVEIEHEEVQMGRAEVRKIYKVSKIGNIAGCFVEEGTVGINHKARLVRNGTVIWTGQLATLRRLKDDAKEVLSGLECGIGLKNYNDIKEGDIVETHVLRELEATLVSARPSKEGAQAD